MGQYAVYQDGRPLHRGLSQRKAEELAKYLAHGYESHVMGTKRRVAEFDVRFDKAAQAERDQLYKQLKEES